MVVSPFRLLVRCRYLLVAVVAALANPARAEQAEAGSTPEKLVALRYDWHLQLARQEAAEEERKRIAPARVGNTAIGNFRDASTVLNELRLVLTEDYKVLRNAAQKYAASARQRREESKKEWEEVYKQRIAFRQYTDQQQTAYGFDYDSGTHASSGLSWVDAGVILWAAVVFVVAVFLSANVRRVSIRRMERGGAPVDNMPLLIKCLILFAFFVAEVAVISSRLSKFLPFLVTAEPTPDTRPWSVREEAKLVADTKEATESADAATAEANKKWAKTLDAWAALVTIAAAGTEPVETILRDGENDVRKQLQEAAIDAQLAERLAVEADAERGQLAADKAKLSDLSGGSKWRAIGYTAARCLAAAVLLFLAISPYWRARRKEAALIKEDAKKCPRCFSERLIVEKTGAPPGSDDAPSDEEAAPLPRYRAPKKKAKPKSKPQAKSNDDSDGEVAPEESGYVECKSCSFRFLRSYQKVRRLCFPVVGVRASGKTHMLATAYNCVRRSKAPAAAVVQPAPSLGDARFEHYIDMILNLKQEAGGTVHAMPDPVMLHVRDKDSKGSNTALVNLFDYSGELVDSSVDVDRLKKQAVKMDGFMLFLDPTQLYGDGANLTLDRQIAKLNEFMADMREARKIPVGQIIPVPVAICIPKFDLLLTENPIQGQCVPFIHRMLEEMNPQPKQTTLATIQGRSEIVEDMLELMFRGVDVRGLVESYFGPQVMFFPVSSVSLFENELGIKDLSKRTIAPFGVAEPFLWLMHMHGYEVFAPGAAAPKRQAPKRQAPKRQRQAPAAWEEPVEQEAPPEEEAPIELEVSEEPEVREEPTEQRKRKGKKQRREEATE